MTDAHSSAAASEAPVTDVAYALKLPVVLKSAAGAALGTLDSVTLSRLTGRDMRDLGNCKGHGDMLALLVQRSARIPPSTYDQLDAEDVAAMADIASAFIGGALRTGAT